MLRRMSPSSAELTGGDLSVDILHTEDSVQIGDGTNLLGTFPSVGGLRSLPVANSTFATDATLTGGSQRSKITDGVDNVEIDDVGGEKALKVSVISMVAGGGGGTAATDGSAFTADASQGTPAMGQYDANESDTVADGEMGILSMTSTRHLKVAVQNSVAVTGTFWQATQPVSGTVSVTGVATDAKLDTIIGHVDGLEALLTTIDADTGNIDSKLGVIDDWDATAGAAHPADGVMTMGSDGTNARRIKTDSSGELQVDVLSSALPSGASTLAEQQSQTTHLSNMATSLGFLDDAIFTDDAPYTPGASKGMVIMAQADDTSPDSVDEGDAGTLRMTLSRFLKVQVADVASGISNAIPVSQSGTWNVGTVTTLTSITNAVTVAQSTASNLKAEVVGSAAHDNGSPGVPIMVAGRAKSANPTAVADGDVSYLNTDLAGRVVVQPFGPRELVNVQATTITSSTSETTIVSSAASTYHDLVSLTITNSSSTALIVTLKDSTGGTTRAIYALAANGGITIPFPTPLPQSGMNANWTLTCGTSVASIYVSAVYVKRA